MLYIKEYPEGIDFKVYVQPKSSRNAFSGLFQDALKINLTAPPVDGAANKMCMVFIAKYFNVSKSLVEIISGHSSRNKVIRIRCGDEDKKYLIKQEIINLSKK